MNDSIKIDEAHPLSLLIVDDDEILRERLARAFRGRGFDVRARLWRERRWLPEVTMGLQDFAGTGVYAAEYFVATKRFEGSALGWGRVPGRLTLSVQAERVDDGADLLRAWSHEDVLRVEVRIGGGGEVAPVEGDHGAVGGRDLRRGTRGVEEGDDTDDAGCDAQRQCDAGGDGEAGEGTHALDATRVVRATRQPFG